MQIEGPADQPIENELDVIADLLPLSGARVLELGCGAADKTRQIADGTDIAEIVAAEVDQLQHRKNLSIADLPRVSFVPYGAEAIAEADASFDLVIMFKSLHHVPVESMDEALRETARVLKLGGLAYVSEPVFAGDFNEVIRLFHDESGVRREAFDAITRSVASGMFALVQQRFFKHVVRWGGFEEFEDAVINVTHTEHKLDAELLQRVREKFGSYASEDGYVFETPNRVDVLRKL